MEIIKQQINENSLIVTIKIDKTEVKPDVDKKLKEIKKTHSLPGFRAGAVPMTFILKKFGKAIWWETLSEFSLNKVNEYIKNENIKHFETPVLEENFDFNIFENIETTEEFSLPFQIELIPEFDENEFYKTSFTKYKIKTAETTIDEIVADYRNQFGDLKEIEKTTTESLLKLELTQTDENQKIIDNGIYVEKLSFSIKVLDDDVKSIFVNHNVNDEINTDLKKIISNSSELASMLQKTKQEIEETNNLFFNIKILEIKEFFIAELDSELFDKCFEKDTIKTEEEFRSRILEDLISIYEKDSIKILKLEVINKLKKQLLTLIPLPEKFLKRYLENKMGNQQQLTEEQLNSYFEFLRWDLFRNRIFNTYNISFTNEDVFLGAKNEILEFFEKTYGIKDMPEDTLNDYIKQVFENENQAFNMQQKAKDNKVLNQVLALIEPTIKEISIEELSEIMVKYQNGIFEDN